MATLAPHLEQLRRTIASKDSTGVSETGVPGVLFFWMDEPSPRSPLLYDTGIVIVGQGYKEGWIGARQFRYDADSCLVLGVPVPFECASYGTRDEPLFGIRIDIDPGTLHSLVLRLTQQLGEPPPRRSLHRAVEPLTMDGPLLAATTRLLESLSDPLDRDVVGAAAVEEIVYRVLRSEQGHVLLTRTQQHTPYAQVARALDRIHRDFQASIGVEDLATQCGMAVSSFHRAFKEVTGDTPLQYLKKVRLLKAKGLLVFEGKRVDETAYEVGYASPSQFSREFKRYFDVPPSEAANLPYTDLLQAM